MTTARNLEDTHDTRCRKKKNERRITIPVASQPLERINHSRSLVVLDPTVTSLSKSPSTKKAKRRERFVSCCSCYLISKCSDRRCIYRLKGLSCSSCRSLCCANETKATPSSDLPTNETIVLTCAKSTDSKNVENPSRECSPIPFRLLVLGVNYTLPRTKRISPLSVPEKEKSETCKSTVTGQEGNKSAESVEPPS